MHKVEIVNIDHRASEKRLVISYKMKYACSNPLAPVGWGLIPNGCGYRNICGDWVLMTPNEQHPEHSPTTLEGKICSTQIIYKFVWDYEGEFGLSETEFESDHSYIVALALDDQSCGWVDPCTDPATCNKVPGQCSSAGQCVEGDVGTQGNCCPNYKVAIDANGCPYCEPDSPTGPSGTGPTGTGPGTDPTGPWTSTGPFTWDTGETQPDGPYNPGGPNTYWPGGIFETGDNGGGVTWEPGGPHWDGGPGVVFDDGGNGGPSWGPGGNNIDIGGEIYDPEPPGVGPVLPTKVRWKCVAPGTELCYQSTFGHANINDCINSVYCGGATDAGEGEIINDHGDPITDAGVLLSDAGYGDLIAIDPTSIPNDPKGTPPQHADWVELDPDPDDDTPGWDNLPNYGGWSRKETNNSSTLPGTAGSATNKGVFSHTNTVVLHGGVEGNYFDTKMDRLNSLLRRGAKIGRYQRSIDPEVTNFAKSTNYERLAGTNRSRGVLATRSINNTQNPLQKPRLSADHGPKTAIKIVGRSAFYKSNGSIEKDMMAGSFVSGRFTPVNLRHKRYRNRRNSIIETRGLLRAGHQASPIFFDEDSQKASTLRRRKPIKVPKAPSKGLPDYLETKTLDNQEANWKFHLHSRLASGYSRSAFVTASAALKEGLNNGKEYQLRLWAVQGKKKVTLASTKLRKVASPLRIAGVYPLDFPAGEVTIVAAIEDSDGKVHAVKHVKLDIHIEGTDSKGGLISPATTAQRNVRGALLSKLAEGDKFTFYMERSVKKLAVRLKPNRTNNVSLSAVSDAQGNSRLLHSLKLVEPTSSRVIMQNRGFLTDDKTYNWKRDKKARGAVLRGFDDGEGDIVYLSDKVMQLQISQIDSVDSHWTTVCLGKDLEFVPTELNVSYDSATNSATCTGTLPLSNHEVVLFATGRKYVVRTTNSTTVTSENDGSFSATLENITDGMFVGLAVKTSLPLASSTLEYTQVIQ